MEILADLFFLILGTKIINIIFQQHSGDHEGSTMDAGPAACSSAPPVSLYQVLFGRN